MSLLFFLLLSHLIRKTISQLTKGEKTDGKEDENDFKQKNFKSGGILTRTMECELLGLVLGNVYFCVYSRPKKWKFSS